MKPQQLLIAIVKSVSAEGVRQVLDQYATSIGKGSHLDLANASFGGREANAHSIHAMGDVGNAAYEKITNMHDAVIEHMQRTDWFRSDPSNATEALREIGERQKEGLPGVYVVTATAAPLKTRGSRTRHETNVSFIDEGVGIRPTRMPDTILSLGGSNKLSNPLMAGCYGQGGSAIHAFTDFSLVMSRSSEDPGLIGFTVVYEIFPKGARAPTYAYLTSEDGSIITVRAEDLDPAQVAHPSELDGGSEHDLPDLISNKLILPDHGTVVKVWNLSNSPFSRKIDAWSFLRDRGFSIEAPTRLRVGTKHDMLPDGKRRLDVLGMRNLLSGTVPRGGGRDAFHNLAYRVARGEAFGGQADLHCWIRDYIDQDKAHEKPVIEAVTGIKDRVTRPIYVTLNGMAHFNLHSAVLLRNARLEWLAPHMIMEIDIDRLDVQRKGRIFTSSREHMKSEALEELKEDIDRWLREQAADPNSELAKVNAELRERAMRNASSSANSRAYTEAFMKMMNSSVFGAVLNTLSTAPGSRGGRQETPSGPAGSGDQNGELTDPRNAGDHDDERLEAGIDLNAVPTWIAVSKKRIQAGAVEYVRVRTDATNDWSDAITLELPSFLGLRDDPTLENGRKSFLVEVNGPVGSTGEIVATLDRSRLGLEPLRDSCVVEIVRHSPPQADDVAKAQKAKPTMPEVVLVETSPSAPDWGQIATGATDPSRLAMSYIVEEDRITVLWNRDFPPIVAAAAHVKKGVSESASDHLLAENQTCARLLALMHLNSGTNHVDEQDKISWGQSLAANAVQTATAMIMRKRSDPTAHDPAGLFGGM